MGENRILNEGANYKQSKILTYNLPSEENWAQD